MQEFVDVSLIKQKRVHFIKTYLQFFLHFQMVYTVEADLRENGRKVRFRICLQKLIECHHLDYTTVCIILLLFSYTDLTDHKYFVTEYLSSNTRSICIFVHFGIYKFIFFQKFAQESRDDKFGDKHRIQTNLEVNEFTLHRVQFKQLFLDTQIDIMQIFCKI